MRLAGQIGGLCFGLFFAAAVIAANFSANLRANAFAEEMEQKHGLASSRIIDILAQARRQPSVLALMQKQPEDRFDWLTYRARFVEKAHIRNGARFTAKHQNALQLAETRYGVPASIITAIIGIESNYGRLAGAYRALDALATLAFSDNRRAAFFRQELEELFLLADEQQQDLLSYRGSFAGAMGWGQFLPSSYRHYGVDFDQDGKINLLNDADDIIGSIANYLKQNGWRQAQPVLIGAQQITTKAPALDWSPRPNIRLRQAEEDFGLIPVTPLPAGLVLVPDQLVGLRHFEGEQPAYWMALDNFYALLTYNRSSRYVMAVFLLSRAIQQEINL